MVESSTCSYNGVTMRLPSYVFLFFFFNDTATTEIYTLSLHDALPISRASCARSANRASSDDQNGRRPAGVATIITERTSTPSMHAPGRRPTPPIAGQDTRGRAGYYMRATAVRRR